MLGLLLGIYHAGRLGVADVLTRQIRQEMQQWKQTPEHVNQVRWSFIYRKTQTLAELIPQSPDVLELQAQLYYWQLRFIVADVQTLHEMVQTQALNHFLYAAQKRPSSAYTWSNIALLKYYLRQYDTQFFQALKNTALLGSWEPLMQRQVIEIGLINWYYLPPALQTVVVQTIEHGLQMPFNQVSQLIQQYRRHAVICQTQQPNTPLLTKICS
ncbi:hypothetical protein [Beggiatoa alba]|nr:hypothetical protein [Beggiatoa alba]